MNTAVFTVSAEEVVMMSAAARRAEVTSRVQQVDGCIAVDMRSGASLELYMLVVRRLVWYALPPLAPRECYA